MLLPSYQVCVLKEELYDCSNKLNTFIFIFHFIVVGL